MLVNVNYDKQLNRHLSVDFNAEEKEFIADLPKSTIDVSIIIGKAVDQFVAKLSIASLAFEYIKVNAPTNDGFHFVEEDGTHTAILRNGNIANPQNYLEEHKLPYYLNYNRCVHHKEIEAIIIDLTELVLNRECATVAKLIHTSDVSHFKCNSWSPTIFSAIIGEVGKWKLSFHGTFRLYGSAATWYAVYADQSYNGLTIYPSMDPRNAGVVGHMFGVDLVLIPEIPNGEIWGIDSNCGIHYYLDDFVAFSEDRLNEVVKGMDAGNVLALVNQNRFGVRRTQSTVLTNPNIVVAVEHV